MPATAVSGVYIARLHRPDLGHESHITFIVRDDASHSDLFFQTSDTTWQAYNRYGAGADFYHGNFNGRAYKLSYNRPFATRDDNDGRDFLFSNEYPAIRFLERNGYDITYTTGVDSHRRGDLIRNHKVFLSLGHDEYWSGPQWTNVEAARDAGVNLMFLSGNEVYWRTRWEASQDGSNTAFRTLVCYKETWAHAPIDPSNEWTGTFRDPRFSPPAVGGGVPENALTGTAYLANHNDLALQVPPSQGKFRLWRNTDVRTKADAGQTATLAPHTVGYESDEDLDNGFRPEGLIRLSTTTGPSPQILQDFGTQVAPGNTTHHLTLYKAPSGALVFGAGTVQFAWGLDDYHDGISEPADPSMRQAIVNLLADMGASPATLMGGLVSGAAAADTVAPTVAITSPAAGSTITRGSQVTLQGTAADTGGGQVASVEVSTDGGTSWHPATGTTSWSYTFVAAGSDSFSVLVRGVDDSANIAATPTSRQFTLTGPHSLFGAAVPPVPASGDTGGIEVGVRFKATTAGSVTGVRFYKGTGNTGTHTGSLWSSTGTRLATGTFTGETASGWQTLTFASPVALTANTTYVATTYAPNGNYALGKYAFSYKDHVAGPLVALRSVQGSGNGVFRYGGGFPTQSFQDTNYFVDVLFTSSSDAAPTVVSTTPTAGANGVAVSVQPTATFSKDMNAASIQMTMTNSQGGSVAGTRSYNSATKTATFAPSAALATATTYTVTVQGSDTQGNPMSPTSWSFTTDLDASIQTLFAASTVPANPDINDNSAVELGVRFVPATGGTVTGVRFYRGPGSFGTYRGSLWTSTGTLLAQVNFPSGSTTGWQTASFSTPVNVTAGTTYVVSYLAPNGHYSADANFFTSTWTRGQLSAPSGGNGLYRYGASGGFPTSSYLSTNYYVDVMFLASTYTPPTVVSTTPAAGANGVAVSVQPTATFSKDMNAASLQMTMTNSQGGSVAGTRSYNSATKTVTFTPSAALAASQTYTVTVQGNDTQGNPMSPTSWSFTTDLDPSIQTLFPSSSVPANPDVNDNGAVELGVRFVPAVNGTVTGVRFYKGPGSFGTYRGSLWTASGTLLAQVTFPSGSATGWQTATFSSPVTVTAGTTYVVSYFAPNGHYSANANYFGATWTRGQLSAPSGGNGVYRYGSTGGFPTSTWQATNYWVDVMFVSGGSAPAADRLFLAQDTPQNANWPDAQAIEVGVRFTSDVNGSVSAVRFYKGSQNTGTHRGSLWTATGELLATGTFSNETASGWQTLTFSQPVQITAGTQYVASYHTTVGYYAATPNAFSGGLDRAPLHVPASGGVYRYGGTSGFPNSSTAHNFWVDVIFSAA